MLKDNLKLKDCKKYKFPHGAVFIGPSDETLSCGFLLLDPDSATPKMIRPLPEHIKQIKGSSEIEIFNEQNKIRIKQLKPGDKYFISTGVVRVHRNRTPKPSINYWEYQGNATALIDQIRSDGILDKTHT